MKEIIGQNIKKFREACKFTAEQVASHIGVQRSAYANYEAGIREMPLESLEKVSDLFGCELSDLISEGGANEELLMLCSFRADGLTDEDVSAIASFKAIVKNYMKMNRLLNE